jgi:sugar O-acyltransferase (sialic acid O-acetyltransferase NeuD family)
MTELTPIRLPQSGANDTTAVIVEWARSSGQWVNRGEVVAVAETTKSVFDVEAPAAGYLYLLAAAGSEATVGAAIALLGATAPDEAAVQAWQTAQQPAATADSIATADAGRNWTKKAELLAQRHGVALEAVPAAGDRITEADVQAFVAAQTASTTPQAPVNDLVHDRFPANRPQRILIVGGGNGAVQILDALAKLPNQQAVAILDDNGAVQGKTVAGVPIVGPIDLTWAADALAAHRYDAAVISISTSIPVRARIYDAWKARGIPFANIVHPSCVVGINVAWGEGNVVMALCHVGACATVGDNNFVSAFCSIEHHCVLGSHCSFGPGVVTSSRVHIGDRVRFGTGIFVEPGVTIGEDSVIASGLAIAQPIPARSLLKARLGYTIRTR